jgi:hypothetical protein
VTAEAGGRRPLHTVPEHLWPYVERAESFVRSRHWDDPEMLAAAALLVTDQRKAVELLNAAVEKGGGGTAWAAYAGMLVTWAPDYVRLGNWRVDPRDPSDLARGERELAELGAPTMLSAEASDAALQVVRGWAAAQPENGMPLALEADLLYGSGRDAEALARWEEAARRPEATAHQQEIIWAASRLLRRMGMSEWESVQASFTMQYDVTGASVSACRRMARVAVYEGRLAQMEGQTEEALRWWTATIDLGRHMQESAKTANQFLVGIAVSGVGAAEVWPWRPDRETGIEGGPLEGGRLYQGSAYADFVSRYGSKAAREVRDGLVRAKLRSSLMKGHYARYATARLDERFRAGTLRAIGVWYGVLLVAFLVVWTGISISQRQIADEATGLSRRAGAAIALGCLAPIMATTALWWCASELLFPPAGQIAALSAIAVSLLAPVFVPLIIVRWTRRGTPRARSAWRGNMRRVLPPAMLVCAVISLGAHLGAVRADDAWARQWYSQTEMERTTEAIGPYWFDPPVPRDAWREAPPPSA